MKSKLFFLLAVCLAVFTSASAQLNGDGYYRVRHMQSYGNRYLSVIGNTKSELSYTSREMKSTKMLSSPSQLSDPGSVIKISYTTVSNSLNRNVKFECQGVRSDSLYDSEFFIASDSIGYKGYTFINGLYQVYVKDYGLNGAVIYFGETDQYWSIEPLTEASKETSYFGAVPSVTIGDSAYYTTMFTTFPYKMLNGVQAFYYGNNGLTKIDCDTVPSNTPVVLKLVGTTAKSNTLIPSTNEPRVTVSGNKLVGVLKLYDGTTDDYLLKSDSTMAFLTQDGSTVTFAKSSSTGVAIANNTAYLPVSALTSSTPAKSFGSTTGISSVKSTGSIAQGSAATIYDLQGRKVTRPGKGIYIINGKKVMR